MMTHKRRNGRNALMKITRTTLDIGLPMSER